MKIFTTIFLVSLFYWTPVVAEPKQPVRVEAIVTAYTSLPELTDSTPFTMANGKQVHYFAMACPRKYQFGTIVKGLGEDFVCEDRMNHRYENQEYERFDIWVDSLQKAKEFGSHKIVLYIYQ